MPTAPTTVSRRSGTREAQPDRAIGGAPRHIASAVARGDPAGTPCSPPNGTAGGRHMRSCPEHRGSMAAGSSRPPLLLDPYAMNRPDRWLPPRVTAECAAVGRGRPARAGGADGQATGEGVEVAAQMADTRPAIGPQGPARQRIAARSSRDSGTGPAHHAGTPAPGPGAARPPRRGCSPSVVNSDHQLALVDRQGPPLERVGVGGAIGDGRRRRRRTGSQGPGWHRRPGTRRPVRWSAP